MAAVFRDYGEGFYGYYDDETGEYLGATQPVSPSVNPQVPPPPPPPPPASQVDRAPAPATPQYRTVTVDVGEGSYTYLEPIPAPPPPPPPPANSVKTNAAPVPAPAPAEPFPIAPPAGDALIPGSESWQIRQQVDKLKDNTQLQAWLATTTFSSAAIAKAYPEFAAKDIEAVREAAKTDGRYDPKNPAFANMYADTNVKQQFGNYALPKPVKVDKDGNPVYAYDDPALKAAQDIVAADTKLAWDRAVKEIYDRYNVSDRSIIVSAPGADGYPEIQIKLPNGEIVSAPTGSYFAGIPKVVAGDQFFFAQPRPLSGFETGYADRVVKITPPLQQSVSTQLPNGSNIVVDPTSELARAIQYLGTQNNSIFQRPFAELWAERGVTDPYTDPATVQYAIDYIERVKNRRDYLQQNGITPEPLYWDDPNWPKYVGTTKEAFLEASRAADDPVFRAQLIASQGWSQADYESWSLSILNPEENARRVAEAERARGVVAGPSSSGSGTSTYALSTNSATVVETATNQYYANGAPVTNVSNVSNNSPIDPAAVASGAASTVLAATAALSGFASAGAALSAASSLISGAIKSPAALPDTLNPFVQAATGAINAAASTGLTTVENLFSGQAATLLLAKNQATLQARYNQAASSDWRVRLQLAPGADYLYKTGKDDGILGPLFDTDGVIFPYMPSIETSYAANYDKYDLTHSNYRGYFYKGSNVNDINMRPTFTAQDTQEPNYLLAVIHFFRSVTKMFYGQDTQRGTPPPLVYLSGYGNQQFSNHPCVVGAFNYSLPNEVDYIRTDAPNNFGPNMSNRQMPTASSPGGSGAIRLANALLNKGAIPQLPAANPLSSSVNNTNECTYVPTKMEIDITLIPVQTRSQVSKQFSLKEFANGNLLKKGFW